MYFKGTAPVTSFLQLAPSLMITITHPPKRVTLAGIQYSTCEPFQDSSYSSHNKQLGPVAPISDVCQILQIIA